jgi:hypothetical protein
MQCNGRRIYSQNGNNGNFESLHKTALVGVGSLANAAISKLYWLLVTTIWRVQGCCLAQGVEPAPSFLLSAPHFAVLS